MELKEFFRKHLLEIFVAFIAVQLGIFALFQNINHRPQAIADQMNVIEGKICKIAPLTNDVDKDEKDVLSISHISKPHSGTIKQNGNLLFYQPLKGFLGKDSITYTVTDGKKESKQAHITIQVSKNQAPVTHEDHVVAYSGNITSIYVLENDEDKERDSLLISDITKPLYGEVKISEKTLVYNLKNSSATADSFYYTANDGSSNSEKTLVKVIIQKKNNVCYPWLPMDIGDVLKPGKVVCSPDKMTVQASGSDIWNNSDGFFFIYQQVSGDCEITTRVDSLEGDNEWTKSGLMIRENLSPTSRNVFLGLTTQNGITSQGRIVKHGYSENAERKSDLKAPYWIKLGRENDKITFSISSNGQTWEKMYEGSWSLNKDVYIGFAVTSHNKNELCKTVFSNYKVTAKQAVTNQTKITFTNK